MSTAPAGGMVVAMPPSPAPLAGPIAEPAGLTCRRFSKAKPIAARLGICSRTLFRWANAGLIARHKINARVVLFDETEVAAFVMAARVEAVRPDSRADEGRTAFEKPDRNRTDKSR